MEILLKNEQKQIPLTREMEKKIFQVVREVVTAENLNFEPEISILLVDNDFIQDLNQSYRGLNQPTDVLSFALEDELRGEDIPDFFTFEDNYALGDIVISMETAQKQAIEYGHSLVRELAFLTVHGMLHLLGYDHQDEEEKQKMRQQEENILSGLGIKR